jgi:hypothetical protein
VYECNKFSTHPANCQVCSKMRIEKRVQKLDPHAHPVPPGFLAMGLLSFLTLGLAVAHGRVLTTAPVDDARGLARLSLSKMQTARQVSPPPPDPTS